MIQHLKLFGWKGLNSCVLDDLGKINVVCGRNNSGKSTVLECIDHKEHRAQGVRITEELLSMLYSDTVHHGGWWRQDADLDRRYQQYLAEQIAVGKVVYGSDVRELVQKLVNEKGSRFSSYGFPAIQIGSYL